MKTILSITLLSLLASACGGPGASDNQPSAVEGQIARGAQVFGEHCAGCHGSGGEGTRRGLQLVGAGAFPLLPREGQVRSTHFRTALDIAMFATSAMPPDADDRAELVEADYWAVLAFALSANGVALTEPVSPQSAGGIVLH